MAMDVLFITHQPHDSRFTLQYVPDNFSLIPALNVFLMYQSAVFCKMKPVKAYLNYPRVMHFIAPPAGGSDSWHIF